MPEFIQSTFICVSSGVSRNNPVRQLATQAALEYSEQP